MVRRLIVILLVFGFAFHLSGARKLRYLAFAVNNFVTAKPVTGFPKLFYSQFHPGITVSTGFNWSDKKKHSWMQTFKFAYFSHRFIQHSFTVYSEIGYRYKVGKWGYSAAIGAGYLHMVPGSGHYRKNEDGEWEPIKLKSRPQANLSISLGVDRLINENGMRAFTRYQNMLQAPFIPGYVPLLPYNVLHVGVTVPLALLKKGAKDAK